MHADMSQIFQHCPALRAEREEKKPPTWPSSTRPGATTDRSISRQQRAAGPTLQWLSSPARGLGWPAEQRLSARQAEADWQTISFPRVYLGPRTSPGWLARPSAAQGDNESYTNSSSRTSSNVPLGVAWPPPRNPLPRCGTVEREPSVFPCLRAVLDVPYYGDGAR